MAIEFLKKTFFSFDADEVCSGFSMLSSSSSFCQRFTYVSTAQTAHSLYNGK